MGHLFFVFTPLQLFVAQQIIRQENLENCIIIEGYRSLFGDSYDMMILDELWYRKIEMEDAAAWDGFKLNSLKDIKQTYNNYRKIKTILIENNIKEIYLGEILNQACRFTCILFSHEGYHVNFFEEGTSHYIDRPYTVNDSLLHNLKIKIYDTFYYKPLYHISFAKWRLNVNMPYNELPIHKRYSMIPFHYEDFDILLKPTPMFSDKLLKFVKSNIKDEEGDHRVMLMTDPLRELIPKEYLYLYFDTIKEAISSVSKEQFLYIKFHPREIESSRKKILEIANQLGIRYKVLSEEVNICVEYYLQKFYFDKIFFFNAATYFYNGYAFPKMNFVRLMPVVYKKCKEVGVQNLTYMENMLKMISPETIINKNLQKQDKPNA